MGDHKIRTLLICAALAAASLTMPTLSLAQAPAAPPPPAPPVIAPSLPPNHVVNLMTADGSALFGARWKTMEAKLVEIPAIKDAMPGYKTTYDWAIRAGEKGFDDAAWPVIEAKDLAARRGGGKVSFMWYRATLTVPAKAGDFDTAGSRVVLSVNVDDYAEVWVDGLLNRMSGRPSPAAIQGMSMPNRVILSDAVKPGDKFEIAVFGINGPISFAPMNFVWFRDARVEFYR